MGNAMVFTVLGVFGIIVLLMAVYGYIISAKTSEDYMLAGRGIGIVVMFFFTLFAISSAWTFYGYSGFLYQHGPSYVYFVWGCVAGFASLYMFLGPRLWAVARLNRFLSPLEMMSVRYNSKALRLILVILLLGFIVPYICIQPIGVGLGFKALCNVPPAVGIIYTCILLIFIVMLGGMRITAWVNVLLGGIDTIAFLVSLLWIINIVFPGGLTQATEILSERCSELLKAPGPHKHFDHVTIGGLFIVGMLAFSWPHIVIGTMTAREKHIFKWFPLLAIVAGGICFYTIPFIWGSIVAPAISYMPNTQVPPVTGKEADYILQTIVTTYLPKWFAIFVLMGVIAAAVSTAAVQLMTSAIFVSKDLIHGFIKPDATDKQLINWTKIAVITLVIISVAVAFWNPIALAQYLTLVAVPGFAQWAPCLLGAVLWKRGTGQGAIAGTLSGSVLLLLAFVGVLGDIGTKIILISIIVNALVYVIVSLFTTKPSEEIKAKFFDEVDEFLSSKA
jgi:SSS family solute:Na+ symporter